jgi:methylated-DNA-protein-cysteine methyltransferase-like protein
MSHRITLDAGFTSRPSDRSAEAGDEFAFEVLAAAAEIPCGKVATYGQLARLVGREKNSRLVGRVLSRAEYYGDYPCHRVVNAAGRLAPGFAEQAGMLRAEGVELKANGCVDLKKYGWKC